MGAREQQPLIEVEIAARSDDLLERSTRGEAGGPHTCRSCPCPYRRLHNLGRPPRFERAGLIQHRPCEGIAVLTIAALLLAAPTRKPRPAGG